MNGKVSEKIQRWLLFGALFSVLPFVASWVLWKGQHSGKPFHLYFLWERGELLIASAGFAADAVGECISTDRRYLAARLWAGGICIVLLFIEAVWFAALQATPGAYDLRWITGGSVGMFLVTLVASGICKFIAAQADEPEGELTS